MSPLPSPRLRPRPAPSGAPFAVSPREAARLLDIGLSHLYDLMRAGELHDFHSGRARRITVASIESYVARQLAAARAPFEAAAAKISAMNEGAEN